MNRTGLALLALLAGIAACGDTPTEPVDLSLTATDPSFYGGRSSGSSLEVIDRRDHVDVDDEAPDAKNDDTPDVQEEEQDAGDDTPDVQEEEQDAGDDTPDVQEEEQDAGDDTPDVQEEEQDAGDDTPDVQEEEQDAGDDTPDVQEEEQDAGDDTPDVQEEERDGDDDTPDVQEEEQDAGDDVVSADALLMSVYARLAAYYAEGLIGEDLWGLIRGELEAASTAIAEGRSDAAHVAVRRCKERIRGLVERGVLGVDLAGLLIRDLEAALGFV